ncbi:MAG: hypothetical protein IJT83_13965 [Victivallales bacterium]|nr:hypothetical protein [Victivallales bacterium]
MKHLDRVSIQRYLEKDQNLFIRLLIRLHLLGCEECQKRLRDVKAELEEQQRFFQGIALMEQIDQEADKHPLHEGTGE